MSKGGKHDPKRRIQRAQKAPEPGMHFDAPSQQTERIELQQEDQFDLLNVLIAEFVFGLPKRQHEGQFEWLFPAMAEANERWLSIENLPKWSTDGNLAMDLFEMTAKESGLIPSLIMDYGRDPSATEMPFMCGIARRLDDDQTKIERLSRGVGATRALAICWAMVLLYRAPIAEYHKELFPQRYIVTS